MASKLRCTAGITAALALAVPATAQSASTLVAKGLSNPRGIEFGPDGALYVAEAGRGGPKCIKKVACFGFSGAIARITPSGVSRVVRGLASGAEGGYFGGGATDVTFDPNGGLVTVTNGLPPAKVAKGIPVKVRAQASRLASVSGRSFKTIAKLDTIELAKNPDKQDINPNPYGVERIGDTYYVIDAGGNDVLAVNGRKVTLVSVIKNPAKKVQPVPTAIATGPDGALYIAEFAPGPGVGQVVRVVPGQAPTVVARKLPSATGIDVAADGTIYLSTFGTGGHEARPKTGTIMRIGVDGAKSVIEKKLNYPAGLAIGPDGDLYVANGSTMPGIAARGGPFKGLAGEIRKVDLP